MADHRFPAAIAAFAMLAMLSAGACTAVVPTSADRYTETGQLVALSGGAAGAANACFTCHGLDGRGDGAGAPRLAGLDAGYLHRQMEGYASGLRRHPQMEYVARQLSARDRLNVSTFYAAMPFTPGEAAPSPSPVPTLYVEGDRARGIQACADCHGLSGEGAGSGNPALGGQPPAYLARQLDIWPLGERRNDPINVMLDISRRLTPAERRALADYAGGLPGGPPHPGSPEAFPAEYHANPRSDASGLRPHEAAR